MNLFQKLGKREWIMYNSINNKDILPDKISNILQQYVLQMTEAYDTHIHKIILFGSYARGDYHKDSDIDIMVLVDYPREEIGNVRRLMSDICFDLSFDNDIEINPIMQNIVFFEHWIHAYPFYNVVAKEGIELYAA